MNEQELLEEYLAGSPSNISAMELKKIAGIFGLSYEEVRNIARGMTEARRRVAESEPEAN